MNLNSLDKRLVTILLIVFVQMVGAGMILPILPLYAKNEFAMSPTAVTLLIASFFAAQFVAGPFLGRWSDKVGRVPVLIISQIGTVIAFLALGLAGSIWMLFASRILDGLTGGNIVVAQAYVTDVTPRENRAQALGLVAAMFGLAFMIGPAIGGLLLEFGTQVPYFLAAGAAAVVVLMTVYTLDESMTTEEREALRAKATKLQFRAAIAVRPLMLAMTIGFVAQFALGLIIATFALFGEEVLFDSRAELGVGLLLGFVGLSQILTQTALLPSALKRFGEVRTLVVGVVIRSIGLLALALTVSPILRGSWCHVLFDGRWPSTSPDTVNRNEGRRRLETWRRPWRVSVGCITGAHHQHRHRRRTLLSVRSPSKPSSVRSVYLVHRPGGCARAIHADERKQGRSMGSIGFVGLGIMGHSMAKNLLDAGHTVTEWNRTESRSHDLVAAGAVPGRNSAGSS